MKKVRPLIELLSDNNPIDSIYVGTRTTRVGLGKAIRDNKRKSRDEKLAFIKKIFLQYAHESILEHGVVTLGFSNVSRLFAELLETHRLASYLEKSFRASRDPEFTVYWDKDPAPYYDTYMELRESGLHPERARFELPLATVTDIVVTVNMRELFHILDHFDNYYYTDQPVYRELQDIRKQIISILDKILFYEKRDNSAWIPYILGSARDYSLFSISSSINPKTVDTVHYREREDFVFYISGTLSNAALAQLRRHRMALFVAGRHGKEDPYDCLMGDKRMFIWSINGRSLSNFMKLRTHPSAQKEIRDFADLINARLKSRDFC